MYEARVSPASTYPLRAWQSITPNHKQNNNNKGCEMKYFIMLKYLEFNTKPISRNSSNMADSFSSASIPLSGFIRGINDGKSCDFLVGKASNAQIHDDAKSKLGTLSKVVSIKSNKTEVSAFFLEKKQERNLSQPQPINKLFQHKENLMVKSQP